LEFLLRSGEIRDFAQLLLVELISKCAIKCMISVEIDNCRNITRNLQLNVR
jgi:hypothetical protein